MKSYTDIEQSCKLAKILPLESADMWYDNDGESIASRPEVRFCSFVGLASINIPCWSLAALLDVLSEYNLQKTDWGNKTEYKIVVTTDEDNYASKNYDNPIDAAYELILKLNELNLL